MDIQNNLQCLLNFVNFTKHSSPQYGHFCLILLLLLFVFVTDTGLDGLNAFSFIYLLGCVVSVGTTCKVKVKG